MEVPLAPGDIRIHRSIIDSHRSLSSLPKVKRGARHCSRFSSSTLIQCCYAIEKAAAIYTHQLQQSIHICSERCVGTRHLQTYYAWRVLQVVLHFIDEQSSRYQFHQDALACYV